MTKRTVISLKDGKLDRKFVEETDVITYIRALAILTKAYHIFSVSDDDLLTRICHCRTNIMGFQMIKRS